MTLNQLHNNKIISTAVLVAFFFWQSNIVFAQAVINNALPQNPTTVVGSVTYDYSVANTLTQTSTTDRSATDWNGGINVGQVNTWNIVQPNKTSISLNRDISGNPSAFWGAVKSNGNVFLENANGVFFGASSQVDVNGVVASTLHISNNDFSNGNYKFYKNGGSSYVVNQGNIHVANGGYVALLSNAVSNSGSIVAPLGRVALAAGEQMTVALDDASDISVTIDNAVSANVFGPDGQKITDAIKNSGSIQADGGKIILTSKVLNNIFDNAVNNSGTIQANSLVNHNGIIELLADGGNIKVASTSVTSAKASDPTAEGGKIYILSNKDITVENGAVLDVSGGSVSGNGGLVDLGAAAIGGLLSYQGTFRGTATAGYSLGQLLFDRVITDMSGFSAWGNGNSNTQPIFSSSGFGSMIFGDCDITNGSVTMAAGLNIYLTGNIVLNNATLNLFADRTGVGGSRLSPPVNGTLWGSGAGFIQNQGSLITGNGNSILNLQAGGGIGSFTAPIDVTGQLSVNAAINPTNGTGGVYINNTGSTSLNIGSVSSHNGTVDLNSTSGISINGAVNAGTGNVTLNSGASITQGSGQITASTLDATAVNNISLGQIGNKVDVLDAHSTGTGNISFNDSKNVTLDNVTTNNGHVWTQIDIGGTGNITAKNVQANNTVPDTSVLGDVYIGAWNGNVLVNNVSAGSNGTAQFQAIGGSVIGQNTNANYDVTGKTVVLNATYGVNGLDANNALRTQTSNINALKSSSTTAGDININNTANGTDPLTLTGFAPAGRTYGVANNNGNINIQTNSSLVTAKDVQTPKGNVNLTTTGANSDITVNGGVYGGYGTGGFGNIALNAGGNVIQSSGSNPIKSTGTVTINAGKSVSQVSGSILADAANFVAGQNIGSGSKAINTTVNSMSANAGGLINLNQTGDVIINNLTSNTDSITFNGSGKANVGAGGIHSNVHDITLNTSGPLTLNGNVDAGEGGANIALNVASGGIQQNSGSVVAGQLTLTGPGAFNLTSATNDVDTLVTNVNGVVNYTDVEAPIFSTVNGSIGIKTQNGDVIINALTNGIQQAGVSSQAGGLAVSGNGSFTLVSSGNNVSSNVNINAVNATVHYDNVSASLLPNNLTPIQNSQAITTTAAFLNNKYVLPVITELPKVQINTFDPISSSIQAGPVFLYHPLTQLDSDGFNGQFQLDEGAYDFIDDEIKKKKKKGDTT